MRGIEPLKSQNEAIPTFLYAMPFSSTRVFLGEIIVSLLTDLFLVIFSLLSLLMIKIYIRKIILFLVMFSKYSYHFSVLFSPISEETSLVGRPAVPFPEIQERMAARLEHLGIKVKKIEEEE